MRYLCTVYNRDYTLGSSQTVVVGTATVAGHTVREAAARAYVRCVGSQRARVMQQKCKAPRAVIAQETNFRAIAACLRKTSTRLGDWYRFDNLVEAWDIHVEPLPASPPSSPRLPERRSLPPLPVLLALLQRPSWN
jgi:hypothetical protein